MLVSKTSWLEFFWLIDLMLLGRRLDAAKVLAPYIKNISLIEISIGSINTCTAEIREFFEVLANEDNLPVFIHCTQGKDRTGLTIMLVLFLLNIRESAIEHDYLMSGPELVLEREERVKEIASIGLSERFADVSPGLVGKVHTHISQKYGSLEKYLDSIGVNEDMQDKVKRLLLVD
jgi:protein tyrosine/serine phosphatase